jgi:hypothetical protein
MISSREGKKGLVLKVVDLSCFGLSMPFLFTLSKNFHRLDSSGYKKSKAVISDRV